MNTSLVQLKANAADVTTDSQTKASDTVKPITSFSDLQSAANSGEKSVTISGNITAVSDLNVNSDFTINGEEGASLTFSNDSAINNNGNLTLNNITVNGSIKGNGTVTVEGTVNSNVTDASADTLSNDEMDTQIGQHSGDGVKSSNWKAANISASKVDVEQGATLNINRDITGDGIAEPNGGVVNVGVNAKLNINLKDAQTADSSNEKNSSLDNANAGVRIVDNGTFTTGDSAEVTINAGHGRAVVIDEPFGGTSSVSNNTSLEGWENGRTGDKSKEAAKHRNTMTLGDSTKMNLTGRGGIVLGYTATFTTGDHSIIHIDNKGNGEGLLLDANSVVEISPHSQLLMTSDGKNASGYYGGGNYIGMGQNAKFRVEHDAIFRYKVTNSANNEKRPYADNFNIISQASNTHPEIYVGNNATFDGQSDYDDYYGEIVAFSLTSGSNTSTVFQIDGAKYVNWEKNTQVKGHSGAGNLYYSMSPGLIDATGQKYYVFKWNNKNLNDNNYTFDDSSSEAIAQSIKNFEDSSDKYWTDIEHLATKYSKSGNTSEWPGHTVSGNDIKSGSGYNPTDVKTGTPIGNYNSGDGDSKSTTGFDPLNSQRLVLVASTIPTQEDETSQVKTPYKVIIRENDKLEPGQVKLVQRGQDGLSRTTKTTYYNVDPSTGEKTLDTTKGDNGVSTKTTVINEQQDEIIEVAPQTAIVKYYQQDDNGTQTQIQDNGKDLVATVTGIPIVTDTDGSIKFDDNGNAEANTVSYNDSTDLSTAKTAVSQSKDVPVSSVNVISNEWEDAVKNGTNKYNVTGLTRDAITSAAEKAGIGNVTTVGPTEGPTYKVVLGAKQEQGQAVLNFVDDDNNGTKLGSDSASGDKDNPITFADATTTLKDLTDKGYEYVSTDGDGLPSTTTPLSDITFPDYKVNTTSTFTVHLKHGTQPVTPENPGNPGEPINPNDPDGPKYPNGTDDKSLTKEVTRTIVYKGAGDKTPASVEQTVKFTQSGVLDKVTGEWTTPLTWSEDQTFNAQTSPKVDGYHVVSVDKDTTDKLNVDAATISHDANDYTVTVTYEADKPTTPDKKPATGKVTYIDDTTNKPLKTDDLNGNVGDKIDYTTKDKIQNYENEGYELVSNNFVDGNETFKDGNNNFEVHLKHGTAPVGPNDPHDPDTPVNPDDPRDPDDQPKWPAKDTYTKEYTSTLHYQYADGTTAAEDKVQTSIWTRTLTIDKVTGEVQNPDEVWTSNIDTYKDESVPVINGYVARKQTQNGKNVSSIVAGDKAVQENLEDTVIYDKIGNIVPQNPDGNPIPDPSNPSNNVPDQPYTNDPSDPTKVTPNEPVPDVPGYTPNTPSVTPEDPTKDTPVIYNKNDDTKVTGKQVVHYVDDQGNTLRPDEVNDSFEFTQDSVTKQWNETGHKYKDATAPVINGYVAKEKTVAGQTATPEDPNKEVTVVYSKIGKIVPVDKDTDKPIPDAPTPSYSNDPQDPTKVVPNEPVPNIPNYRPVDPTPITPEDPTKDTEVPYAKDSTPEAKDQTAQVIYQDVNDPANPVQLATSGNLTGKSGDKINYSTADQIKALEDKGYVLVNNGFPTDAAFDNDDSTDQTFYVTFKHGTQPVTPENPGKPGEPINPNNPDGPKYPDGTDADSLTKTVTRTVHYTGAGDQTPGDATQTVTFNAGGILDKVTGKWITPMIWSADQPINGITSPTISGYHVANVDRDADGANVAGITIKPTDNDYTVTVTYVKDGEDLKNQKNIPSTQTVKFVDEQGNELHASNVKNTAFNYSGDIYNSTTGELVKQGSWNETSHTYDTVDVPVIDGYVAVSGYTNSNGKIVAGGLTATTDDPNVIATVVYKKIGNIVPQDPDGNPIPDPSNPTNNVPDKPYTNDPSDPTKVTPNEPVPDIPGYTPSTPSVTPEDPGKDTPVIYTPEAKDQVAQVIYQDVNDPANPVQLATSGNLTGKSGDKINYSTADQIKALEDKGYVLVNDGFPTDAAFDNDDSTTQTFYVTFKHGTQPVTPENPGKPGEPINPNDPDGPKYPDGTDVDSLTKTGKQTIHYVGAGDQTPADNVSTITFKHSVVIDKVTGKVIQDNGWTPSSHKFDTVDTPVIEKYHADRTVAGGKIVTVENPEVTETVTYSPNGNIVPVLPDGTPVPDPTDPSKNVPDKPYTNDPQDPTKVVPNEPVPNVPGYTPSTPSVTPEDPGKDTPVVYTPDAKKGTVTVIFHDTTTNEDIPGYGYKSDEEPEGTKVTYNPTSDITSLENKGYVVDGSIPTIPTTFTDGAQTVTINMKHGTQPVTPENPGKPGEPINPNNPDGPKYPDGTDADGLTKTGKQTIHYVGAGDKTPKDSVSTTTFEHKLVIDKVTGKIVQDEGWTPSSHEFDTVNTPVIEGYHVDKTVAGGKTVTVENPEVTDTVTYTPNGHIIPVTPDGNKIPGAPTPQYPTNPKDPTGVVPNESVPVVPGYTPNTSQVTPSDPAKDTPVVYTKDKTPSTPVTPTTPTTDTQKAIVNFINVNDGKTIATSGILSGEPGSSINGLYNSADQIEKLEAAGYEVVYNAFDGDGVTKYFDNDGNTVQQFTIGLKPITVSPVQPETPDETPSTPSTPDTVSPVHPTDEPSKPETPTTPTEKPEVVAPVHSITVTPSVDKPVKVDQQIAKDNKQTAAPTEKQNTQENENTLPQTGAKDGEAGVILGAAASLIGLAGLAGAKKRRKDDD